MARYQHAVRVQDDGSLRAECAESGRVHWTGRSVSQAELGVARAHVEASRELSEHVAETGHARFQPRHGPR